MERAIALFENALKLAKSEMELTHIYSLKDAAHAQLNVTGKLNFILDFLSNFIFVEKMGLSLQSLMSNLPNF